MYYSIILHPQQNAASYDKETLENNEEPLEIKFFFLKNSQKGSSEQRHLLNIIKDRRNTPKHKISDRKDKTEKNVGNVEGEKVGEMCKKDKQKVWMTDSVSTAGIDQKFQKEKEKKAKLVGENGKKLTKFTQVENHRRLQLIKAPASAESQELTHIHALRHTRGCGKPTGHGRSPHQREPVRLR